MAAASATRFSAHAVLNVLWSIAEAAEGVPTTIAAVAAVGGAVQRRWRRAAPQP